MSVTHIAKARQIYSVDHWSAGYFDISPQGYVDVGFNGMSRRIPLVDVVDMAREKGLRLPLLIRFAGILSDRVRRLCKAFSESMADLDYNGSYTLVYPIKVNQQQSVVQEIVNTKVDIPRCSAGLEAGSKPELMAVLAMAREGSTIVCNGYKDREYIRLALIGEKTGRKVYIVVEKLSELQLILEEAEEMQVTPRIGLRTRLNSHGKGNWQNTGGEKSKFGLAATQIIKVLAVLRASGKLDCLQLLHFHLGSQISNIRDIQAGMKEAARYFSELRLAGAGVQCIDVGGGLGVDYEGTRSRSNCSMNYSMEEYAYAIVQALRNTCDEHDLDMPDIFTESGRAVTAHHAVLVSNVIGCESPFSGGAIAAPSPDASMVVQELYKCYVELGDSTYKTALTELYHEVVYRMSEANDLYTHGVIGLEDKAMAEELYYASCARVGEQLDPTSRVHQEIIQELNEKLADKVFLNFSLFQSVPDVWGIDQIFPIVPVRGLDRPLLRRGKIQDITCDSDGCIDQYVDSGVLSPSLPMPAFDDDEEFSLAIFMVGAYQEILGDMHNLFGDTDSVVVRFNADGEVELHGAMKGDTVDNILKYVNFEPKFLLQKMHEQLLHTGLSHEEQNAYLSELREGLIGYTYLE
ncbi:Arginine decarboxylase [gamma proteobacterium HdN1]|nr:Arginine decarboxylase [gamma proteobacterium HdN1]